MAEIYESELVKVSAIDFEGIVIAAARLVSEHEWLRKALAARFPILAVDEYQDLGVPLHEIVMKMCFVGGVRLVAVGDPDQSIYGFTGAKPELLRALAERPDVERIDLRVNYRSPAIIVEASQAALRQKRSFETSVTHSGGIQFHSVPAGLDAQAEVITNNILPQLEARGIRLGDVAVLYRDQHDGATVAAAARKAGLKYIRSDSGSPFPRSALIMWLEDCALWCAQGWRAGTPRLNAIVGQWIAFGTHLSTNDRRREARRDLIRFLYAKRDTSGQVHNWLAECRGELINRVVDFEERPDDLAALERLERATAPSAVLHEMTVLSFGLQRGAPDHLNLTTLFSCKGSEFDAVIIPGLEQGRIPNYNATTEAELGEERRLFYVGLTRARKEIHLLWSGWYIGGNRRRDNGPSQFIGEVREAVDKFNDGRATEE
jgi:DNA helicase-2/ATP-dependent DNA helicase PcrA